MIIYYKTLHPKAEIPKGAYEFSAGWDLTVTEDTELYTGRCTKVPIGIAWEPPENARALIFPRSSTGPTRNILVHPAVIDSDYRGEWFVQATYLGPERTVVLAGERIAQAVIGYNSEVRWSHVPELQPSERGERGWGSTGR